MKVNAYFDAHCDTLLRTTRCDGSLYRNDFHISLEKSAKFAHFAQVFAIFNNAGRELAALPVACAGYREQLAKFRREMDAHADHIVQARNADELEAAWAAGKSAAILAVEGAEQLSETTLDDAYAEGVRLVTLTWNHANALGGSCVSGGGLTDFGRAFVRRANELGVLIDLSHASDELFWDTLEASRDPIIASHSNSREIHPHRRNLDDGQFMALIQCGGTAGINMYADFLSEGKCEITDVLRHIDHFFTLGGEDNVTLGTDFDGCDRLPEGINSVADMTALADALARLGYTNEQIEKIFYKNLLRVFREVTSK